MYKKIILSFVLLCISLFLIAQESKFDNLSLGIPGASDCIVDRVGYALGYDESIEQPRWVIYRLTQTEAITKKAKRTNKFREDYKVPSATATDADYYHSGYDRGHLAPAADMSFSSETMMDSFYYSNMSPQAPAFNRGIWSKLERYVRQIAKKEQDIYIVTGPIFIKKEMKYIGKNNVAVPDAYYKIIYDRTPPQKMIGFILPNAGSKKSLSSFAVTVDKIELMTNLDFFSALPDTEEEKLESTITIKEWF